MKELIKAIQYYIDERNRLIDELRHEIDITKRLNFKEQEIIFSNQIDSHIEARNDLKQILATAEKQEII